MNEQTHGWCSLRLRFDGRELELLKGAEEVRGASLAHTTRPEGLRSALSLAKAGRKLGVARPGASVSLDEIEVGLLLEALRFATDEVRQTTRTEDHQDATRREAVAKGTWRSFGLLRELEALAARLSVALKA